jgi:hypothetical protein
MKKILFLVSIVLISCITVIQAQVVTQKRNVGSFKGIQISGGIDLYLTQGNTESVSISAAEDRQDDIKVDNNGGVIRIYIENSKWGWFKWNNKPVKAYVTVKDLNSISATGGSDVYSEKKLELIKLTIRATGGSDVKLEIDADEIDCSTTGGSDVTLIGNTTVLKASSTGGSDLKPTNYVQVFVAYPQQVVRTRMFGLKKKLVSLLQVVQMYIFRAMPEL